MSYYSIIPSRRKGRKNWKKRYEIDHSRERALERYNIQLTNELRSQIIDAIKRKEAILIQKESLRRSLWKVHISGYPEMVVVYDKYRKEILTVLHDTDKKGEAKVSENEIEQKT
ncbi:MAG: hypothetical protein ABIJ82_03400 [Patescibacteria group bacterium]|nr:hypothetical protein [Patescibacteria group bacterium]